MDIRWLLLAVLAGAVAGPVAAQTRAPAPTWSYSMAFLTTFIDTADALATACKPFSRTNRSAQAFADWQERNAALKASIDAAGVRGMAVQPGRNPADAWQTLRTQQRVALLARLGAGASEAFCDTQAETYRNGIVELRLFPHHLRAVGVDPPKE